MPRPRARRHGGGRGPDGVKALSSHGACVLAMRDSRGSQDKSKGVFRVVVEP